MGKNQSRNNHKPDDHTPEYTWLISHLTGDENILWLADENAKPLIEKVAFNSRVILLTNRYDIYCQAMTKGYTAFFNDFDFSVITVTISKVICRIPKEKTLLHHLSIESQKLLNGDGEFVTFGQKNQGIKSHDQWLKKSFGYRGGLKKKASNYHGRYNLTSVKLDNISNDYVSIQKIQLSNKPNHQPFFSKPGVFGWNKIDRGSELLLEQLKDYYQERQSPLSLADIGCGYGWLLMNVRELNINTLIGTDNNAAAIRCAKENMHYHNIHAEIVAADCTSTMTAKVDCVVCNPPFHQGFNHDTQQTEKFIKGCANILNKDGRCFLVVNQFVGIKHLLDRYFSSHTLLALEEGFTVVMAKK